MEISGKFVLVSFLYFYGCCAFDVPYYARKANFVDLVKYRDYNGRSYHVMTQDGYILRVDRILGGPYSPAAPGKPVVLLQHGLLACSETFVMMNPKVSLAYLLVDAGYDVWVSNFRGNTNCRAHKTLSTSDPKFWNFTIDDLGTKDLPAVIDFTLSTTQQTCLTYIGHSMGTTASYILLSERPEYIKKISFLVSLAPVVLWRYNVAGLIRPILSGAVDAAKEILHAPDYAAEVFGRGSQIHEAVGNICLGIGSELCLVLMNTFLAHTEPEDGNMSMHIRTLLQYLPAGTSLKIFQHYRQMANSGLFCKYNHGIKKNLELYGKKKPPMYDVRKVTNKVALIWAHNDIVAHDLNVRLLAKRLPNVVTVEPVRSLDFHHADFIFSKKAKALIWDRIIALVNQHHVCLI